MEPPGTRTGSTASTAVAEGRAAAQRRAEEVVARIRAEKAAAAAAAANGGEAANTDTSAATSPRTPSRTTAFAQTPERTPQIPTPVRVNQPSTTVDASVSTAPSAGGESSTVLIGNRLTVRTTGTQLGGGGVGGGLEPLPESGVTAPQSPSSQPTSPARAARAATALDKANAAIEAARRASATLEGVDAELSTVAQSIGSAVYVPAGGGSGMGSGPTSPVTTISIGPSGSTAGAGSYHGGTTSPRPMSPNTPTNLDLRTNDSAFHVMASTLLTRIEPRLAGDVTSYTLTAEDRAFLERMMPHTVRWTFVDALRYRREALRGGLDAIPIGGESTTAELTRRCCYLGFDRPEDENALLQPHISAVTVGYSAGNAQAEQTNAVDILGEQKSEAERDQAERERQQLNIYKEQMELQQQQIQSQKEHIQLLQSASSMQRERSVMSEHTINTSSDVVLNQLDEATVRDRDQLSNEVSEARKMMNSASNAEAANFWKAHVEDLEGRLEKLGADANSVAPSQTPQPQKALSQSRSVASNTEALPPISPPKSALKPPTYQPTQPTQPMVYDGQPMVDVIAPADLPAGYTFEAQMGSKRFLATVPPGGVRRGNRFSCPMKSLDRVEVQCPTAAWRDGLFRVFKFGIFHPLFLNALFLPLIAVGQIMSRNHLTWFGDYGYRFQSTSVFTNMLVLVLFWGFLNILFLFVVGVTLERGHLPHYFDYVALILVNVGMLMFSIFAVGKTRAGIRARYHIPPSLPCGNGSAEDYLFATFCMPCTISQMGRHSADFDRYRAVCCSGTGLPAKVDVVPEPLSAQGRLSPVLDDSHFV